MDWNPLSESSLRNATVTGVLFQPFALGCGSHVPDKAGAVRSILIGTVFVASTLPALSVAKYEKPLSPSKLLKVTPAELPGVVVGKPEPIQLVTDATPLPP